MIAQGLYIVFFGAKNLCEIPMGSPPTGAPNRGGGTFKAANLDKYLAISQKSCKIWT